jgi:hypothetical protein
MARHLSSAAVGVLLLTEQAQELVAGRLPQEQRHPGVPVVRVEVVVAGAEIVGGAHLGGLLPLARDHERRLALAVEDPGPLVHPPGQKHVVVDL